MTCLGVDVDANPENFCCYTVTVWLIRLSYPFKTQFCISKKKKIIIERERNWFETNKQIWKEFCTTLFVYYLEKGTKIVDYLFYQEYIHHCGTINFLEASTWL